MTTTIAKRQNDSPSVTFGNVVDNVFQNSLRRFFDDNFWDVEGQLTSGTVPVNVRETGHQFEMDVIAPGCKKEDFNISINDNLLTISFNTKSENTSSEKEAQKLELEILEYHTRALATPEGIIELEKHLLNTNI